jgi:protein-S-isoprenylcysteine O-methyltransferase Ste14
MKYFVVILGTLIIILFSWFLSIRYKRYHGISRFFVFESIFILAILNYNVWFRDPFSLLQIISWILMFLSIYAAVAGYLLLKRKGNPDNNFENTSVLVRSGIYGYIRHPLYFSLFLLGTGIVLKKPETVQLVLGVINTIAAYITARIEEKEMIAKFGDDYMAYMKETKMFIPFVV